MMSNHSTIVVMEVMAVKRISYQICQNKTCTLSRPIIYSIMTWVAMIRMILILIINFLPYTCTRKWRTRTTTREESFNEQTESINLIPTNTTNTTTTTATTCTSTMNNNNTRYRSIRGLTSYEIRRQRTLCKQPINQNKNKQQRYSTIYQTTTTHNTTNIYILQSLQSLY